MQSENPGHDGIRARASSVHSALAVLLATAFALELASLCAAFEHSHQIDGALLVLVALSTLAACTRQLPLQNVVLAAFGVAMIGGAASMIGARTGVPFGPVRNLTTPQLFNMPWTMPLIWIVVVLNARGVGRLALRPWRKIKTYGYWLIGITAMLATLFEFGLETFSHVRHLWLWPNMRFAWQMAPVSNFFSWFAITLLILAFVTPVLINKQLSKHHSPDLHPLVIWIATFVVFTVAAAISKLWLAAGIDAAIGAVTVTFAIRGARW